MKRIINIVLLLVSGSLLTAAQEVPSRVIQEIPYYDSNSDMYIGNLRSGEVVFTTNHIGRYSIGKSVQVSTFNVLVRLDTGGNYRTYAEGLVPRDTVSLFDEKILITYEEMINPNGVYVNLPNEMWIPSYYSDVLRSKDRETLVKFEPYLLQYNTEDTFGFGVPQRWYHVRNHINPGMSMFYNSAIYIGSNSFLVKSIEKTEYGYKVNCFGPEGENFEASKGILRFDWSLYPGGEIDLLLYVDGEYIDMYINDSLQKFGTLVRVKEEFTKQYENLLETNTCDLTNVIWPRRADGSMDYPPPQLTQAVPEQPKTVATDTPQAEDAAAVTPARETVAQQPGTVLPLIIVLAAAGIAVICGVVVFLIRRKR
jgi:hypothetical protein